MKCWSKTNNEKIFQISFIILFLHYKHIQKVVDFYDVLNDRMGLFS